MDLITPDVLPQVGAGGLVVLVVLLVLTGRLVPRSTLRDSQRAGDARVADAQRNADELREALSSIRTAITDLSGQVRELNALGQTSARILSSLHDKAGTP